MLSMALPREERGNVEYTHQESLEVLWTSARVILWQSPSFPLLKNIQPLAPKAPRVEMNILILIADEIKVSQEFGLLSVNYRRRTRQ